jgi:hypothetical protein
MLAKTNREKFFRWCQSRGGYVRVEEHPDTLVGYSSMRQDLTRAQKEERTRGSSSRTVERRSK